MIKAAADPIETANQPVDKKPVPAAPSFPTHNPAQQNKSFMTGSSMPPANMQTPTTTTVAPTPPTSTSQPPAPVSTTPSMPPASKPTNATAPVSNAPAVPAKPKFPDPTQANLVKADGTTATTAGSTDGSSKDGGDSKKEKPKKKLNFKTALGVIVLLIIVLGSGAGFYLTQQAQDLRQQAVYTDICPQGEQCPGSDGTLRSCTPPEADGTTNESLCNGSFIGNVANCGNVDFCCNGAEWTGDMTACPTVEPLDCNSDCTSDAECSDVNPGWTCDVATDKCRLITNPASETCEEAVALECNDVCTTDIECSDVNADWTCDAASDTCRLTSNPTSVSCAEEDESVACNENCTTDSECQLTDDNYICDLTTDTCRLDSNLTSTTCAVADGGGDDDDEDVIIGCNDTCVTNSDCSNSNQICVTTSDGSNKCRLESYTSSTTCTIPESSSDQPDLPGELPETGPEDWLNWLKAGLMTLGIGTALFLLL